MGQTFAGFLQKTTPKVPMKFSVLSIIGALVLALGVGAFAASRFSGNEASQNPSSGDQFPGAVVLSEPGFPSADAVAPSASQLAASLPGARFAGVDKIAALLNDPSTRLLVLPYGSAFPEESWPEIFAFVKRGGNLLVLGGRPFTRSAYHDAAGWKLRAYSVRFARSLMIDQYQTTPGSDGLQFQTNPDVGLQLPAFSVDARVSVR
jgi:hypothetical protein